MRQFHVHKDLLVEFIAGDIKLLKLLLGKNEKKKAREREADEEREEGMRKGRRKGKAK